jgi:hypothetical protein
MSIFNEELENDALITLFTGEIIKKFLEATFHALWNEI